MNLIKKELIEKAAINEAKNWGYNFGEDGREYEDCEAYISCETGIKFAESQLEELAIEFAEWIKENNEESYNNLPTWEAWLTYKVSTNTLFQQFIKERNENT